jgi:ATP-dependent Clp protease protease subunit
MPRIDKDWVDAYFDHGVDIANRRVFIGDIEEHSVNNVVKGLYLMEAASTAPCEMFISSHGGTIYDALALYDIINTLQSPIHTFAYGKCMSAAPLLLAAGEPGHRWISEHAYLMTHDWSDELSGKGTELMASVKHNEHQGQLWNKLIAKHSNKTFKFWSDRGKKPADFFFNAEQAIEWGIADAVWREKKE